MEGIDWRVWSAADRAAVTFLMLQRQYRNDTSELRSLYELVEDKRALAALDNETIHGAQTIVTDR